MTVPSLSSHSGGGVSQAYRLMQERIIEGKNRLPDAKSLETARFTWEQQTHGHEHPPWTKLWERWNEKHHVWSFNSSSDFRRYAVRAAQAVTKLNFTQPMPRKRNMQP